jgi:hypothetical protein
MSPLLAAALLLSRELEEGGLVDIVGGRTEGNEYADLSLKRRDDVPGVEVDVEAKGKECWRW